MMHGIRKAWMLTLMVSGCMPAGAEIGGSPGSQMTISEDMVPDPAYHPKDGDRAILYGIENGNMLDRLPLLKDVTAYDIYVRSQEAANGERLQELEEQGWLQWAPPGSRVLVLAVRDRNHTSAHTAMQVRLADDRYKSQTFWTQSDYINRLIHKVPE